MEGAWTEYWRKEIIDGGPDKKSTEWYCWGKVLTNWSTGDSLVVEVSYPACPGPRDKVRPVCQIFFGTSWSRKQEQKLWNLYKHNFTVRASGESGKDVYVTFPDNCYCDILISTLISFSLKVYFTEGSTLSRIKSAWRCAARLPWWASSSSLSSQGPNISPCWLQSRIILKPS